MSFTVRAAQSISSAPRKSSRERFDPSDARNTCQHYKPTIQLKKPKKSNNHLITSSKPLTPWTVATPHKTSQNTNQKRRKTYIKYIKKKVLPFAKSPKITPSRPEEPVCLGVPGNVRHVDALPGLQLATSGDLHLEVVGRSLKRKVMWRYNCSIWNIPIHLFVLFLFFIQSSIYKNIDWI